MLVPHLLMVGFMSRKVKMFSCRLSYNYNFGDSSLFIIAKRIEYILEWNLRKKCKMAILLYCFQTAGVLHISVLYNLLGPGIKFYRKSQIDIKRKPNYEIGWFLN